MRRLLLFFCASVALLLWLSSIASAQSPVNAPGAMQPSTNTGVVHIMPTFRETGSDPFRAEQGSCEYIAQTQIAYGLRPDLSVQFDIPMAYRDVDYTAGGSDQDLGVGDMELLLKYRVFRNDPSPTETIRVALLGGLQIPGSMRVMEMDNSSDAWDPIIGAIFSTVLGRHGFNASVMYEFYTGSNLPQFSDSVHYDASYLFRLAPEAYTMESKGAWYAVAEMNAHYDLNGDHEIYFSPGIMYESRKFTLDATVMIPVYQDVNWRGETEILIGFGARLSF